MGESDLYCAFCSGPMLRSRIEFTKRRVAATTDSTRRDRTVADGDAEKNDNNANNNEESIRSSEDEDDGSDSADGCTSGYSPNSLSTKSVKWIGMCRCLALNMDRFESDGVGKAFISGHGSPDGMGYFNVHQRGTDPNDTGACEHSCYYSFESGETAAFPFHDACYDIFARSLKIRDTEVNKDILYDLMESHRTDDTLSYLDLDYSYFEGADQFWKCISGLEYCVADPSPVSSISQIIRDLMPKHLLSSKPSTFDLSDKIRSDPLNVLPYDVVYNVFKYLDINDALSLRQASWHVFDWTRRDTTTYGKQMIRLHLSLWFWEVDDFVSSIKDPTFDFARFFLWLEAVSEPKIGMKGPFLGIANRWRIWDTCQQLVHEYQERVDAH